MLNATRITRRHFYVLGGFSDPYLFRKMVGGAWTYWESFR